MYSAVVLQIHACEGDPSNVASMYEVKCNGLCNLKPHCKMHTEWIFKEFPCYNVSTRQMSVVSFTQRLIFRSRYRGQTPIIKEYWFSQSWCERTCEGKNSLSCWENANTFQSLDSHSTDSTRLQRAAKINQKAKPISVHKFNPICKYMIPCAMQQITWSVITLMLGSRGCRRR
jgi:hypothetical protein